MKPSQILIAEDNPGDVLLITQALKQHLVSCEIHVAKDGSEALDYVCRIENPDSVPCPDLVLLDINLPKLTGLEVLAELRKRPNCASIPVILISSSAAYRDREQARQLGVSSYFQKPIDYREFLKLGAVVRSVLEQKRSSI